MVDGPALHGHFGFQTLWIAVSFVLVIFLFGYGAFGLIEIRGNQVADFEVQVEAEQWAWHYEYDSDGSGPIDRVQSNELHIPVNRRVHLTIKSDDVIHSFWVPAFGIKQDAVPGHPTSVYLTATDEGTYSGMCAELCGLGHTGMTTTAVASSQVELEAWLRAQPRPTAEPPRGTRPPGPPLTPSAPPQ
jgi:cytochrome c oxidase subunit 2